MDNRNRTGGGTRPSGLGQRLLAAFVVFVCGYLVYLALSGQYDREVNRFAHWLKQQYQALTN